MNTGRKFGRSKDERVLCPSRTHRPEFSPEECPYGESCKFEHDLRKYLSDYKREDLTTFDGICPVWKNAGTCPTGWKCRFVSSHMTEREAPDGRQELLLVENEDIKENLRPGLNNSYGEGNINVLSPQDRTKLSKRQVDLKLAEQYTTWLDDMARVTDKGLDGRKYTEDTPEKGEGDTEAVEDNRAMYREPPFLPSEKRRLYFGPETPVLAPLTTQGNMPFRRICLDYGCQFTYSEMAKSFPLIQGSKSEWALLRAHESEIESPSISDKASIVAGYENSKDLKFGAQISANKPWQALKAAETLTKFCPNLRVIDLNCGCPIDIVCREGSGAALLDHHSKLEKILRGMNAVSGPIPVSAKLRMGTKDNQPTALKLVQRLVLGGYEQTNLGLGPPGVAAITLHGRSRQQRYTRSADWEYISSCAALVKKLNEQADAIADTVREPEERSQPPGRKVFFLGNGDCYSYEDYNDHIKHAKVDSVMVARGALIKPWIFEEIQTGQYLDKSASERLELIGKFARYGLETWGSDEHGVGTTRRFLLEWLSFAYRYVPIGLLEYLPPSIQDRPPAWRGRNELETLLGSDNYKDWIKIR